MTDQLTSQLIRTAELAELFNCDVDNSKLVVLDASWHMPAAKRDSLAEYKEQHIPSAQFFDIDGISDKNSSLPHMLPVRPSAQGRFAQVD